MRDYLVTRWGVFERKAQRGKDDDSLMCGEYKTQRAAVLALDRLFGSDPNYYVWPIYRIVKGP